MNYENMTDRELDALVAEKVMGFTLRMQDSAAPYASRVECAFVAAEAMRERGYWVEIESVEFKDAGGWHVVLGLDPGCSGEEAMHRSLPRAICIAALRALDA